MVNYLRLGCLVAAVALDYSNALTVAVAGLLLVAAWILSILPYNKAAMVLQAPGLQLSVPFFNVWRPVVNLYYRVRGSSLKSSNYISIYD